MTPFHDETNLAASDLTGPIDPELTGIANYLAGLDGRRSENLAIIVAAIDLRLNGMEQLAEMQIAHFLQRGSR